MYLDTRTTCSTSKYISSSNVKCVISDCELSYYSPPFHFSLHFTHSEEQTTSTTSSNVVLCYRRHRPRSPPPSASHTFPVPLTVFSALKTDLKHTPLHSMFNVHASGLLLISTFFHDRHNATMLVHVHVVEEEKKI